MINTDLGLRVRGTKLAFNCICMLPVSNNLATEIDLCTC